MLEGGDVEEDNKKNALGDNEDEDGNAVVSEDEVHTDSVVQAEKAFQKRQSMMNSEVIELSESILLKEQLVQQLQKSQHQYVVMKAFYEQKLAALNEEVKLKQDEREALLQDIQNRFQNVSKSRDRQRVSQSFPVPASWL